MTKIKKAMACLVAATTMAVSMGSLNVSALTNRYSTISPYKSGSYVYFGGYATNLYNSSTDFTYWGNLKNNTSGAVISSSVEDSENDVGNNVQVSLRDYHSYSALPDTTLCVNYISAYVQKSSGAQPYEQYVSNTYFYK